MERLVSGLEAVVADLESANVVMGDVVRDGDIKRETMAVDGELGGRTRGSRL